MAKPMVARASDSYGKTHSRVKFEKINIWKSQHFMLKFKIISSYEQICTCSSWFSFLSKQTISRPKYFDHWKDHCSYIFSAYAVFWKHILDLGYLCYFHLSNVKVLNPLNNKFWLIFPQTNQSKPLGTPAIHKVCSEINKKL